MKNLLIIKAGSTFPRTKNGFGDFDDWIIDHSALQQTCVTVVEVFKNESLPIEKKFSVVILSGSHSMVTDNYDWMQEISEWIPHLIKNRTPFLGICFGHQLLAQAMGGLAGYHPGGREIGTVNISLTADCMHDSLFNYLPNHFWAHETHSQSVLKLPEKAKLLASSRLEPHNAFRIGQCAWGVQFHPEFSTDIMRAYIDEQTEILNKEDHSLEVLKSKISITKEANSLIKRFVDLAIDKNQG